jgi:type I restriction-modification system DNA methylase subunit
MLPHLLCTTNMLLHGVEVPTNIRDDNTLSCPLRDYCPKDRVDVIVTNSPFGGTGANAKGQVSTPDRGHSLIPELVSLALITYRCPM